MLQVTVATPRAKKAVGAALNESAMIGPEATRVALQQAFGDVDATFAREGRRLDPEDRVGTRIAKGDRLELVLLGL